MTIIIHRRRRGEVLVHDMYKYYTSAVLSGARVVVHRVGGLRP